MTSDFMPDHDEKRHEAACAALKTMRIFFRADEGAVVANRAALAVQKMHDDLNNWGKQFDYLFSCTEDGHPCNSETLHKLAEYGVTEGRISDVSVKKCDGGDWERWLPLERWLPMPVSARLCLRAQLGRAASMELDTEWRSGRLEIKSAFLAATGHEWLCNLSRHRDRAGVECKQ